MATALAGLRGGGEVVSPAEGRWLSTARWSEARAAIEREVREFAARYPARYGIPKGDLKSGLKSAVEASLFDAAFELLLAGGTLEQRGERVRPAGTPWSPPAETMTALEKLEGELEAAGLGVPGGPRMARQARRRRGRGRGARGFLGRRCA